MQCKFSLCGLRHEITTNGHQTLLANSADDVYSFMSKVLYLTGRLSCHFVSVKLIFIESYLLYFFTGLMLSIVSCSSRAGHITVPCSLLARNVNVSRIAPPGDGFWSWILDKGIVVSMWELFIFDVHNMFSYFSCL